MTPAGQPAGEGGAGELASLVGVEDVRFAEACQRLIRGLVQRITDQTAALLALSRGRMS